jgi:uncharacterized protein
MNIMYHRFHVKSLVVSACLTLALFALTSLPALSQTAAPGPDQETLRQYNLQLLARSAADSIVLRWGATDYVTWQTASRAGYVIERAVLPPRGSVSLDPVWMPLTPVAVKPLSIDEWKQRFAPEDSLAGAAVQSLYGESMVTTDDPFGALYEMYLQQQNLHGFAMFLADIRPDLAEGMGLRYVDRTVEPGKAYLYRIFTESQHPDHSIDTAWVATAAVEDEALRAINSLTALEDEKLVILRWDKEESSTYGGFVIERSYDNGRSFEPVTPLPFLPLVNPDAEDANPVHEYRVKLERNYEPALYRVSGIDAFGIRTPPGVTVAAMGRDRTAPRQPGILPHEIVDENSVRISWEVRDTPDADLDGFLIAKSEIPDGPYDIISEMLPVTARSFIDRNVREMPPHYYVVTAVDTAGNSRMSAPVFALFPDSIPPMTPTGLVGEVDSAGIVVLRWAANQEDDLQGYRVFYANDPSHEFQQLTTVITADTVYSDTLTLKTLSKHIFYKVTALDWNFNHSPFTPALQVKKPDIVPPSAPIIRDVESSHDAVYVAWYRSPTSDAADHMLYRRRAGEETWTELLRAVDPDVVRYRDESAEADVTYEYAVQALDDEGLSSPLSNIVVARLLPSSQRDGIDDMNADYDATRSAVVLKWSFSGPQSSEFHVYRSSDTRPFSLYRTFVDGSAHYEDKDIRSGSTYRYSVKVVYPDGAESPLREAAPVVIP